MIIGSVHRRGPLARLLAHILILAMVAGFLPAQVRASVPTSPGAIVSRGLPELPAQPQPPPPTEVLLVYAVVAVPAPSGLTKSAFGELIGHSGTDPQPYAFTGEPLDLNSGFQYHRARWMDPGAGRFLTMDPFSGLEHEPLSLHKYLYAGADPGSKTDPSGRQWLTVSLTVVSIVTVVAGAYFNYQQGGFEAAAEGLLVDAALAATGVAAFKVLGLAAGILGGRIASWLNRVRLAKRLQKNGSSRNRVGEKGCSRLENHPLENAKTQKNKQAGDAFRDELAELLEKQGLKIEKEVTKKTPFGDRRVDIEVSDPATGKVLGGVETKVGASRYRSAQRAKDNWLRMQGYIVNLVRGGAVRAKEAYGRLLSSVAKGLRPLGFTRRRSSFYTRRSDNWGVIHFQRSTRSTSDSILFTVNLGVTSSLLRSFFAGDKREPPEVSECHWSMRLGFLCEGRDRWWSVEPDAPLESLDHRIQVGLHERGVPEIERHLDDTSLRDLWLGGDAPGLTEIQRLMNLVVLLDALGPSGELEPHIETLRRVSTNKAVSGKVSWMLQKLGTDARDTSSVPATRR